VQPPLQPPLRHDGVGSGCRVTGADGSTESNVDRDDVDVEERSASGGSESSGGVGDDNDDDDDDGGAVASESVATAEARRLPSVPLETYTRGYLANADVPEGTAASDLFALGRTVVNLLEVGAS
jgi:hypothetical protein